MFTFFNVSLSKKDSSVVEMPLGCSVVPLIRQGHLLLRDNDHLWYSFILYACWWLLRALMYTCTCVFVFSTQPIAPTLQAGYLSQFDRRSLEDELGGPGGVGGDDTLALDSPLVGSARRRAKRAPS